MDLAPDQEPGTHTGWGHHVHTGKAMEIGGNLENLEETKRLRDYVSVTFSVTFVFSSKLYFIKAGPNEHAKVPIGYIFHQVVTKIFSKLKNTQSILFIVLKSNMDQVTWDSVTVSEILVHINKHTLLYSGHCS